MVISLFSNVPYLHHHLFNNGEKGKETLLPGHTYNCNMCSVIFLREGNVQGNIVFEVYKGR